MRASESKSESAETLKQKNCCKYRFNVTEVTTMLPLSGVALHHRVEGLKQVPNGTNTYLPPFSSTTASSRAAAAANPVRLVGKVGN